MTKEELRLLDVRIAKEILGYEVVFINEPHGWRTDYQATAIINGKVTADVRANQPIIAMDMIDGYELKHYSTNIQCAFELIQKLQDMGKAIIIQNDAHEFNKGWAVRNFEYDYSNGRYLLSRGWKKEQELESEGDTLPEAICNFLLEAREEELI